MELFVNDLSIHKQFQDITLFRGALARLMTMREIAKVFGREMYSHRVLLTTREAISGAPMQKTIGRLSESERRAVMGWLTQGGPFWDELRQHSGDDYLEVWGEVVTDSAVGEAAYRMLHDVECSLVSFTPSDWDYSPIEVTWNREAEQLGNQCATLENWRDAHALEEKLQGLVPPIQSWNDLKVTVTNRYSRLTFADNCFEPLRGAPFAKSAADRVLVLLGILDRFARAFDPEGKRTSKGHQIYQDHFTGDKAPFSDSSDSKKRDFREKLTFRHPNDPQNSLFCPWHGKVSHKTLRVHFSWPIRAGEPVYVVYVGPKLTKQ